MKIRFGVYDWEQSSWVNAREQIKINASQAVRKSSTWKKYLPDVEDTTIGPDIGTQYRHKWHRKNGLRFYPASIHDFQTPLNGKERVIVSSYKIVEYGPGTQVVPDEAPVYYERGPIVRIWSFKDESPTYKDLGSFKVIDEYSTTITISVEAYKEYIYEPLAPNVYTIAIRLPDGTFLDKYNAKDGGCVVEWDNTSDGTKVDYTDILTSVPYYTEAQIGNSYSTTHSQHSVSRIDMLEFLKAYQAENPIEDEDGDTISFESQKDRISRFVNFLNSDTSDSRLLVNSEVIYGVFYEEKTTIVYESTDTHRVTKNTALSGHEDPTIDTPRPLSVSESNGQIVEAYSNLNDYSVYSSSSSVEPYDGYSDDVFTVISLLLSEISYDVWFSRYSKYRGRSMTVIFSKDAILNILGTVDSKIDNIINTQIKSARETPIGKLLYRFGNLDTILDSDVEKMDEFYLSFLIANFNEVNTMEDKDEATDYRVFQDMVDALATKSRPDKWRDYFYAVINQDYYVDDQGNTIAALECIGYIINYDAVKRLPPIKMQAILTGTMRLEYGVPKPKRKISWLSIIVAVVVTVLSYGSLAPWAFGILVASTVLLVAAEITGSASLAKLSQVLGYVASVTALLQNGIKALAANLANVFMSPTALTMMALTKGVPYMTNKHLAKLKDKNDKISKEIDGVKELIFDERMEEINKIQNFIHGEHIEARYTDFYTNMYTDLYNVKG